MIDVILSLLNGVIGFLNNVLPDSPFQGIFEGNELVLDALGWLNWFVPCGELLGIFGVYLAAMLAWQAVDLVLGGFDMVKDAALGK